jgi:8-oxo-dGTP diphosphatase
MKYKYEYPRASVTVDIAVFCQFDDAHKVLLIQRGNPPFEGSWALPGGFIEMDEKMVGSAYRELEEETMLKGVGLKQFKTYGDPGRDPRGRTVSVVYYGFTSAENATVRGGDDAKNAEWFALDNLPKLAFDHNLILSELIEGINHRGTEARRKD